MSSSLNLRSKILEIEKSLHLTPDEFDLGCKSAAVFLPSDNVQGFRAEM